MIFGKIDTQSAVGSILAHSLRVSDGRIRKGTTLDANHIKRLLLDDITEVTVASLEAGDVQEDEAAALLAKALVGQGITLGKASTGRVNCYAKKSGLLSIPRERLLALNQVSESITAATLSENRWVEAGKMVATIKIIPYAVTENELMEAKAAGVMTHHKTTKVCVFNPEPRQAKLIQTTLANTPLGLLEKTLKITQQRLNIRNIELIDEVHCTHDIEELSHQLKAITADQSSSWILISGASAISDRRDVIPQALEQAGGTVIRCGIPVDPGNLLMLGQLADSTVIGIPGCARSPKHNGLDLFMDRLACNLPITSDWINSLAIGGLMDEIIDRPQPRVKTEDNEHVTAILLAGGTSRRFGNANKLLALKNDRSLIQHSLNNIANSGVNKLIIVLGHDSDVVEKHCRDFLNTHTQSENLAFNFVRNTDFNSGMASSLKVGISQLLSQNIEASTAEAHSTVHAAMVFLADMPSIKPATINALIGSLESEASKRRANTSPSQTKISAIVPTHNGSRGNPVILMPELFDLLLDVTGDVGARQLLNANPDAVLELSVNDSGILTDYDTLDQLHE